MDVQGFTIKFMKENRDVQCFKTDTLTSTRSR